MKILARAVGRRKEATAQVRLIPGSGEFIINNKPAEIYLHNNACSILAIKSPFEIIQNAEGDLQSNKIDTIVKVEGGGLIGQSEAIKLAVARAVCQLETLGATPLNVESGSGKETSIRKSLKDKGYLTQDARVKERRKYGLKKARKASQYHKR